MWAITPFFVAFFGVMTLAFDIAARRQYRAPRPWLGTLRRDLGPSLYALVLIPFGVYLASYAPWFASETGVNRHEVGQSIGENSIVPLPDALRSLWHYTYAAYRFHAGLTNADGNHHPWESKPWTWPMSLRPVLYAITIVAGAGVTADRHSDHIHRELVAADGKGRDGPVGRRILRRGERDSAAVPRTRDRARSGCRSCSPSGGGSAGRGYLLKERVAHFDELESHSVNLVRQDHRFVWKDEVFSQFPLTLNPPPERRMPSVPAYEAYLRYRSYQWLFTPEASQRSRPPRSRFAWSVLGSVFWRASVAAGEPPSVPGFLRPRPPRVPRRRFFVGSVAAAAAFVGSAAAGCVAVRAAASWAACSSCCFLRLSRNQGDKCFS